MCVICWYWPATCSTVQMRQALFRERTGLVDEALTACAQIGRRA